MNQNAELQTKNLAEVGEDIGLEKGLEMIQSFRQTTNSQTAGHYIGKNIILEILSQPGCVGINFRKALNEAGQEHLVYTGVDELGNDILEVLSVSDNGKLSYANGIVADRVATVEIDGDTIEEILRKILGH